MNYSFKNCLRENSFKLKTNEQREKEIDGDSLFFGICDDFLLDWQKITQSKSFRRLANKTQVFSFPENPHVRNRMTHTLEVTSINALIADVLGLNVNLVKACSIGHDVGHVPFGHVGERFLSKFSKKPFEHSLFGPIVMEEIERGGRGLNLKKETLLGIKLHSGGNFEKKTMLEEYKVVKLGDKISYTFSDLNDAIRFGYLSNQEMPDFIKKLGLNQRERVNNCLLALFEESCEQGFVSFSKSETAQLYQETREWMFENIYPKANIRIINEELSLAFEAISEYPLLKEYNSIVLFSILTENGVREIAQKGLSKERLYYLGIEEILSHLVKRKNYYDDNFPD